MLFRSPEEKLLRSIFGEKAIDVTDTSLKMQSGSSGIVVDVRVFNRHGVEKDERSITIERAEIESVQQDKNVEEEILERSIKQRVHQILKGINLNKKVKNLNVGEKLSLEKIENLNISDVFKLSVDNEKKNLSILELKDQYNNATKDIQARFEDRQRYLNTCNTLHSLLNFKTIPIINENDTISVEEITFGDNDILSALVTNLLRADLLILLSIYCM